MVSVADVVSPRGRAGRVAGAVLVGAVVFAGSAVPGVVPATPGAAAGVVEIFPGDSFEAAAEALRPGDTLVVHAGTYTDSGRISMTVDGSPTAPVVIRGAPGEARPRITRPVGAAAQNTINVEGASHVTLEGLEIESNGGDGVKILGGSHHITLRNLDIHDVDVGINVKDDAHHLTIQGNEIHRTGAGGGSGEGMYIGCNLATCRVRDSLIAGNWVHDTTAGTQGDGIEIKHGSYGIVVRDNVVHDTRYPCLLLYGTAGGARNTVAGNAVWRCGDSGIQVAADALVANNVVLNEPGIGLNSHPHQGAVPANLTMVHNTVLGGSPCLSFTGWAGRPGIVFANNAVYCGAGGYAIGGVDGVTVAGNVMLPRPDALPAGGWSLGVSAADFVDAADGEVYPSVGSALRGAGDLAHTVATDFNGTARSTTSVDAGAYQWTGPANPGWTIVAGRKVGSSGIPGGSTGDGGYWVVERDGDVHAFGRAPDLGGVSTELAGAAAVAITTHPGGGGFWVLGDDGRIHARGSAPPFGPVDVGRLTKPGEKVATMSATPSGSGLWVFTTAGRIIAFGDATPPDQMAGAALVLGLTLDGPVVDSVATPSGRGAYMVAADGGVFAVGDAEFVDSVRGALTKLYGPPGLPDQPIVGIAADPDGRGYWLVGADGGVFAMDAPFRGSLPAIVPFERLVAPVNGMVPFGNGYLLVAGDGGIFDFGGRPFAGSAFGRVDSPVVGVAPLG